MITAVCASTCRSLDDTSIGFTQISERITWQIPKYWTHARCGVKHRSSGNRLGEMIAGLRFSYHRVPTPLDTPSYLWSPWGVVMVWIFL
jgi:hypothetical protein